MPARLRALLVIGSLLVVAFSTSCSRAATVPSGGAASPAPKEGAAAPAVAPKPTPDPKKELEAAVRAYSAAFLGGQAKAAWLLRTAKARQKDSYAAFVSGVGAAHQIYGDAVMTTLTVTVGGSTARASYKYDVGEIDQKNQRWLLEDGKWLVDN